jgi:stage II sporulation protein D
MNRTYPVRRLLLATAIFLLFTTVMAAAPARAAVPTLDNIRVALFLQLPGKYTSTTPEATFSSPGGMTIGTAVGAVASAPWMTAPASANVSLALDDFKVKVLQTANFNSALSLYKYLQTASRTAYLTSLSKGGAIQYQVLEGAYPTAAEAQAGLTRWSADAKLAPLTGGYKSELQGPFHLETPAYANKAAAQAAAVGFGNAGVDAWVAVREGKGGALYSVMVGAAASADALKTIHSAALKAPGGAGLKAVEANSAYLLLRSDHSASQTAAAPHELYQFPAGDMKLWIEPAGQQPIKLAERSGRTYRGSFELSAVNGKLAVVNELPFEHYLYSVVAIEMYPSWPAEALKAQAVAARSFVLNKGLGFQIAHVVDTTLSQAYYGVTAEQPTSTAAVDATMGEVALYDGKVIEAIYSSSGGGMTADASEAWGNTVPYLQPAASPDQISEAALLKWHRVVLDSGETGYIRGDLVKDTGRKNEAGARILETTADGINVRRHPIIQDTVPVVAGIGKGQTVVELDSVIESNPMNWERGPFTGEEMATAINARVSEKINGPVTSIAVSKRGPSGRVTEIIVNGKAVAVSSPDGLRSVLGVGGSLPSTKFEIEETGKMTVLGAGGQTDTRTGGAPLYVMGSDGRATAYNGEYVYAGDGKGNVRAATTAPGFAFSGQGFGHGVGMSQFGAYSLAQQGYDYQYILQYYYKGITIAKE